MTERRYSGRRGFTLVEVIIFVAVLSVVASTAYVAVTSAQETAKESKLAADVAHVNETLQIYMANGGTLPAASDTTAVTTGLLPNLKKRADAASTAISMGLNGSFLDTRVVADFQSDAEAASSQPRAIWNPAEQRYDISRTPGPIGIKQFSLDSTLAAAAPGTESRKNDVLPTGTATQWVWDYTDRNPDAPAPGATPTAGGRAGPTNGLPPGTTALAAPTYSPSAGTFSLMSFSSTVSLSSPNPTGVSQIYYSLNGAPTVLYTGVALTVTPGSTINAYAASIDPDHYTDSPTSSATYNVTPVNLSISLFAPSTLTYAQAGGAMASQATQIAPVATVALQNTNIPSSYISSSNFKTIYSLGTSSGTGPAFSGAYVSPQISLNISNWGTASSLAVSAQLVASSTLFISSAQQTATVTIATTSLTAPVITPASGQRSADVPVSIALAAGGAYPANTRIYYTVDGSDPGAGSNGEPTSAGKTLYSGSFQPGAGTNGGVTVSARVYGPSGFGQWFTPSNVATATYTSASFPDGALIGSANLNGTFVGSLMYAAPTSGNMNNITFNSGAKILKGNLYLPGQPTIRLSNGTTWSLATDSAFANYIQGWEFDASGNETVQTTPRVIDETGSITPNNYSVSFNNSAVLEGKVVRRHTPPAFPTVAAPPTPDSNASVSLNSHPTAPINASGTANITNNTSAVGDVSLNAGNFGDLTANNGTSFVLGDPLHPDVVQVYSFKSLNLNSGASLKIVGKVILTVGGNININNGSVVGNSAHPDWLQLQMSSPNAQFNANSGSAAYAALVVPTGSVTFNAGSVFDGSVTALSLTINSNGIVFDLPPVIQN